MFIDEIIEAVTKKDKIVSFVQEAKYKDVDRAFAVLISQ